jgi:hypothetical protein
VSAPNRILRNDIKANNIEIFGDAEVSKPCEVYRKDAKDINDEYSLNILFQEGNVEETSWHLGSLFCNDLQNYR